MTKLLGILGRKVFFNGKSIEIDIWRYRGSPGAFDIDVRLTGYYTYL